MALRPIVYSDDPIMRKSSHDVQRITPEIQELVDDMFETMRANSGIGLAAIQVGVPQRVIVIELPVEEEEDEADDEETHEDTDAPRPVETYVVLNPKIARKSRMMVDGVEGCLSVQGYVGEVARHESVTVKGMDMRGKPIRIKADGWLARVFQHETDHCDGILFIDRIEDPEKIWPVTPGEEEEAEAAQKVPMS